MAGWFRGAQPHSQGQERGGSIIFFLLANAAATFGIIVGFADTGIFPPYSLPQTLSSNNIVFGLFAGVISLACLAESIFGAQRRHRAVVRLEALAGRLYHRRPPGRFSKDPRYAQLAVNSTFTPVSIGRVFVRGAVGEANYREGGTRNCLLADDDIPVEPRNGE